jgi:hypothetical protein
MAGGVVFSDEELRWTTDPIDGTELRLRSISIALDQKGKPHIAYALKHKSGGGILKHAIRLIPSWDTRIIDNPGDVYAATLALDSSGYPHIAYYDALHQHLRFTNWDGSSWNKQIVDKIDGHIYSLSIAIDSSENPHISFEDTKSDDLKYAKLGSGWDWEFQTIDSEGIVGRNNSMALDLSDNPHIVYIDETNTSLKYARWDGSSWRIKIVDNIDLWEGAGPSSKAPSASIAVDSSGFPHISYCSGPPQVDLKYAKWEGAKKGWSILTIDNEGDVGRCNAIAVDRFDRPHIAYYDDTNGDLKYARWDGSTWKTHSVDKISEEPTVHGAYQTSIAVDKFGNPNIAYFNNRGGFIEYAKGKIPTPDVDKVVLDKSEDAIDKSKATPKIPPNKLLKVPESAKTVESGVGIQASAQGWLKIWGPVGSVFLGYDPVKKSTIVYATNRSSNDIYRFTGKWEKVGGPGAMFAADHSGHLYGLSPDKSTVVEYVETTRKWERVGGKADRIYAGGDRLYATNPDTGEIYEYSRETGKWMKAGGAAAMFAVDSTGQLYSLSSDRSGVFKYSGMRMKWTRVGGAATHIYAGGNKLFAISPAGGDIYGYSSESNKWSKVGGPGKMFAVGFLGHLYGISSDSNAIYSYSETSGKWSKIGGQSAAIFAGGNTLYSIDPMTHELYMLKFAVQDATPIHLPAIKDD